MMSYSDEIFGDVPFLVDGTRSIRIRYSELARVIDRPIESVCDFADERPQWLGQIAPLHRRRECGVSGGVHMATYYSVGQAVAIAVGLGRSDAEDEILEAFTGFNGMLTGEVDGQVAWRQWRRPG
jgi:hypothetical protein